MWIQRDVKAGVWENAERWVMAVSFFGKDEVNATDTVALTARR